MIARIWNRRPVLMTRRKFEESCEHHLRLGMDYSTHLAKREVAAAMATCGAAAVLDKPRQETISA